MEGNTDRNMGKLIDGNNIVAEVVPAPDYDWMEVKDLKKGKYSFGFWEGKITSKNDIQSFDIVGICKTNLWDILHKAGFWRRESIDGYHVFIRDIDNILEEVKSAKIKGFVLNMIESLPESITISDFKIPLQILKEKFMDEQVALFKEDSLSILKEHTRKLLTDDKKKMYFPFLNGVAKVTAQGIELLDYSELKEFCIWKDHIIQRNFEMTESRSMFADFIENVSGRDDGRIFAMRVAMGYAMHRYCPPTNSQAVIFYDEEIADKDSALGGTGKGITANAISKLRKTTNIDGKRFDQTRPFVLQSVKDNSEVIFIDDIKDDFEFSYFDSKLTNGWEIEHKNKTTITIPVERAPKLIIASNHIMKVKRGTTASRRQFILEFSDYYSSMLKTTQTPIVDVHGCEFFTEWNNEQWQAFDSYMLRSCSLYLDKGLPINKTKNVAYNRLLQATSKEFVKWMDEKKFLLNPGKQYPFGENFDEFKKLTGGEESKFSSYQFIKWMELFAETYKCKYNSFRYNTLIYFEFE